jgi:hypothetical protein
MQKVSETIHVLLGLNNILCYSLLTDVPLFGTVTRIMHIDIFFVLYACARRFLGIKKVVSYSIFYI